MKNASAPPLNDPREITGWVAYDWAGSAFSTTVATALLGPYLTVLAQNAAGDNGALFGLGPLGFVTAKSLFPFAIAVSVFLQVLLLPMLGALADYSHLKKRLMAFFCYLGSSATGLMFFIAGDRYLLGAGLFIVANLSFGSALVLYNAFLPQIAGPDLSDKVSSRGFAWGYMGGGVLLAMNLGLILGAERIGITQGMAVRLSLLSAGLWWGGFSLITFRRLRSRAAARALAPGQNFLTVGFSELGKTFRALARLPHTFRYLIGYMLYNDGIQTVIGLSTVYLEQELFVSRGLRPNPGFLLQLLLMVQFVAFFGAFLFERIARTFGTKNTISLSLALWCGVVVYAYAAMRSPAEAWVMAGMIAAVLGGSQALSRSLFSRMIPAGREASFFGIYEISERGTSWIGPLIFGIIVSRTGSYRTAILSLIALFAAGLIVLLFTNTKKAEEDSRSYSI